MEEDNVLADFMPNKMMVSFKENKVSVELSAGMGMFKSNFIADSKSYTMHHLVKLINKKYMTVYDKELANKVNDYYHPFSIIHLSGTKTIAGYECKRALVVFDNVQNTSFYLHYTDAIDIKDPNWSNPFKEMDQVLLEYRIIRNGISMHFTASQITEKNVSDDTFAIPSEYETISYETMENELNKIFESFNY